MKSITLLSPAKINLTLDVLWKRPDGYHEIVSVMQPVSVFDEVRVSIEEGEGIEVESRELRIMDVRDNLAWKAADLFLRECGEKNKRVNVNIRKRIPVGAGLGGGSSNAAAVLVGLNRLLRAFGEDELIRMSASIGADVAFFIHSRSAIACGIGEKITLLRNFPNFYYVIVNPGFEVSTKEIYKLWDKIGKVRSLDDLKLEDTIHLFKRGEFPLSNSLEEVAVSLYPEIRELKEVLENMGAGAVSMTGSGPSVFGVFKDSQSAYKIYEYLRSNTRFKVFVAQGISGWHILI
ncbi:MAG: 4-diphosphocytidyl-2-C-methyl-D-erythritol kinase [Deltaproteobacteria bacterium]|nr:MAG: 4-diphosphocytidyl-2-C-methyl-D-erythritol kinase [Deltaproteobacteria bacterium]